MWSYRTACVHLLLVIVILGVCKNAFALEPLDRKELDKNLSKLIYNHPTMRRTTITLKVVDLETGEVLYDCAGDKLLTPASNLKIYTAAAALNMLGPDYTWSTEIIATEPVKRGVCNGELLIRGSGDPMLDTEQLVQLADKLVSAYKLKKVRCGIATAYIPRWAHVPIKGPGWMWDDEPDYYNMSIRPLMMNFNTIKFTVTPGEDGVTVTQEPASDFPPVMIVPEIPKQDEDAGVRFEREPFTGAITIIAAPEPDSKPVSDNITMHDPSPWIASVFKRMLEDRGVEVSDKHYVGKSADVTLVSQQGKTLAEAIKHFLKKSENAVGEMLLLKLAETQTEADVSWPVGAKVVTDWLVNTAGLEAGSFRIVDGSGLSRYNLISADSSVKLLVFMKRNEHFEPFFDGLPVYKVELPASGGPTSGGPASGGPTSGGDDKWDGVPLAEFDDERVFAKPGGMSGVSTISGYIKTLDGRWLAFSLLGNGYIGSSAPVRDLRGKVWAELVRYRPAEVPAQTP